ncbi:MAG: putative tellurium resistance membrane protein TerC [Salibacteraceae bacterium]|jgi:predicted tellurium resistance membrane protein TerC
MEIFLLPETYIALLTLTFLEIVLGVDNIIFISILANRLPIEERAKTRNTGLVLALIFRIGLLLGISWIISFSEPLFSIFDHSISGRDLILAAGGLFLIAKSTSEIHHKMEGEEGQSNLNKEVKSGAKIILQIIAMDLIFSFDSILTAVGLTQQISIMIIAVVIAMLVMMTFAGRIADFIQDHPTMEVLALSFLILIGFMLVLDGAGVHVPKGYIYFAVFFSLIVEVLNIQVRDRSKAKKIKLNRKLKSNSNSEI